MHIYIYSGCYIHVMDIQNMDIYIYERADLFLTLQAAIC
jgi:hypothetical protein